MIRILTVTTAAALAAGAAGAATYVDRTAFESDVSVAYTEDFESLGTTTADLPGPVTFATGLTVSSESNELFAVGPGQSTNPTTAIGSNFPPEDTLAFDLGGDYNAFGADLFQNYGAGLQTSAPLDYTLNFYLDDALVSTSTATVAPDGGSFFGYTGGLFDTVVVIAPFSGDFGYSGFEVADNVTVGSISAVPLPSSVGLLGIALGGLALGRRRR